MKGKVISILGFFVTWQIFCVLNSRFLFFNPVFLPAPWDIVMTAMDYGKRDQLLGNIVVSLLRLSAGYGIGIVLGIIVGFFMGKNKKLQTVLEPILGFFCAAPVYALCPLFVIWFGIGEGSKIILISLATFLSMVFCVMQGTQQIDSMLVQSAVALGANRVQLFIKIYFMAILPSVFQGMRTSLSSSIAALVVSEMMGATQGLGYIIVNAKNWLLVSDMFLAIILIVISYLILKELIYLIERKACRWTFIKNKVEE